MKKITNNTSLGKLTMLLNVLVLIFFILAMVFLMKFDKTNMQVVNYRPTYDVAFEQLNTAQHPLKQTEAEVVYYQHKLDTLSVSNATSKEEAKMMSDNIVASKKTLAEKQQLLATTKVDVAKKVADFAPIKVKWESLNKDNDAAKGKFNVMLILTLVIFIAKIVVFATYNYRNSKNLHAIVPWMKDGMPSWLSYVAWFVPIYNLGKPLAFFKEIWEETDYALEDKSITMPLKDNQVDNSGIHIGIWWGLMLCSVWLMNFVLYKTFFTEGALFLKANHGSMTIIAIILLVVYLLEEFNIILGYNKKNVILVENADKFDVVSGEGNSSTADKTAVKKENREEVNTDQPQTKQ